MTPKVFLFSVFLVPLFSVPLVTLATPTSPDGRDLATLCKTSWRHLPICKKQSETKDDIDDVVKATCDFLCQTGVNLDQCNCTTVTTAASQDTTTSLCDHLCLIGDGGSLCDCDPKPPAIDGGKRWGVK